MIEILESASLIALGAAIALLGPVVTSQLALKRERRQQLWNRELDRFFELEELAGMIAERLGGYRPVEPNRDRIGSQILELEAAAGRFRRYPEVTQAIRDLCNTTGWILTEGQAESAEEETSTKQELVSRHKALLDACDRVLCREA